MAACIRIQPVRAGEAQDLRLQKAPRPKTRIQCPQAFVKFSPNLSPTPPLTEVYSAHDHTTKFPTPKPLTSQIMGEELERRPLAPFAPCGREGNHDPRSWEVRVLAKHTKPHPEGTCEGRYPDQERCIFPLPEPPFEAAPRGPNDWPQQRRVRPVAPPKPKSFHPRSCSQPGVGANPAQA
jgi:hypothetical protein